MKLKPKGRRYRNLYARRDVIYCECEAAGMIQMAER